MPIIKWRPLEKVDRLFEDDFNEAPLSNMFRDLAVDLYERQGNVIAEMQVPDLDPKNVDITVDENYLRISGSRNEENQEKNKDYYYKEINRGAFERIIRLPEHVRSSDAKASYVNGVLKVVMPKENKQKVQNKVRVQISEKEAQTGKPKAAKGTRTAPRSAKKPETQSKKTSSAKSRKTKRS